MGQFKLQALIGHLQEDPQVYVPFSLVDHLHDIRKAGVATFGQRIALNKIIRVSFLKSSMLDPFTKDKLLQEADLLLPWFRTGNGGKR